MLSGSAFSAMEGRRLWEVCYHSAVGRRAELARLSLTLLGRLCSVATTVALSTCKVRRVRQSYLYGCEFGFFVGYSNLQKVNKAARRDVQERPSRASFTVPTCRERSMREISLLAMIKTILTLFRWHGILS
jgi:hypothetical protein